jgi:PAS domain S-box-containing protein
LVNIVKNVSRILFKQCLISHFLSWSLEQHVTLLQQANQSVPQSVALLFAEAQSREKKKNAKRVANRKSASTSRARKKALVEEMTKINARLKRQALILALLPDLVITTTPEGEITFCSAQVERILQYKPEDLLGAKLYDLVVPSSREALKCLTEELIHPGKAKAARASAVAQARRGSKRRLPEQRTSGDETGTSRANEVENVVGNHNNSTRECSDSRGPTSQATSRVAAVVSEQSFPLSVVEVESQNPKPSATNENLDTSTNNSGGEDAVSDLKCCVPRCLENHLIIFLASIVCQLLVKTILEVPLLNQIRVNPKSDNEVTTILTRH